MLGEMLRGGLRLDLDGAEDEVRRVDLAVRMRIADADDLALVLEHQHVVHFGPSAELAILLLQCPEQANDLLVWKLGEREIVARRVAHDACDAVGSTVPEYVETGGSTSGADGLTQG